MNFFRYNLRAIVQVAFWGLINISGVAAQDYVPPSDAVSSFESVDTTETAVCPLGQEDLKKKILDTLLVFDELLAANSDKFREVMKSETAKGAYDYFDYLYRKADKQFDLTKAIAKFGFQSTEYQEALRALEKHEDTIRSELRLADNSQTEEFQRIRSEVERLSRERETLLLGRDLLENKLRGLKKNNGCGEADAELNSLIELASQLSAAYSRLPAISQSAQGYDLLSGAENSLESADAIDMVAPCAVLQDDMRKQISDALLFFDELIKASEADFERAVKSQVGQAGYNYFGSLFRLADRNAAYSWARHEFGPGSREALAAQQDLLSHERTMDNQLTQLANIRQTDEFKRISTEVTRLRRERETLLLGRDLLKSKLKALDQKKGGCGEVDDEVTALLSLVSTFFAAHAEVEAESADVSQGPKGAPSFE